MSKSTEYQLTFNTTYLRTEPSSTVDREFSKVEGKCNNFNDRKNGGTPTWIMELHSVYDLQGSMKLYLDGGVSTHYMIDKDGTVYHIVPDVNRAYFAGMGSLKYGSKYNSTISDDKLKGSNREGELGKGSGDMNSWALGIMNVNDAVSTFTPEQVKANVYLHEKLVTDHNLNPKNILGHAEWAPGRKIDPSPYYDWRALATAADKYEDVDHNFGLYPTDVTLKGDPEVVASYKQTASSADVEQIQKQLEELGYSVLSPDEENLGNYDQKTQNAVFSFSIRYLNEAITGNDGLLKLWNICCDDKADQTDARGILSEWTENHEVVMGDILHQYGN